MKTDTTIAAPDELIKDEEYMTFLTKAPIEDFAKYLGSDLDTAVQLRIDEAISKALDKQNFMLQQMDVFVRPIEQQGNLHGFASVTVKGIRIDDFKIVENKKGDLFVGMPSKPDKSIETGYRNTVSINKDYRAAFDDVVLSSYHAAREQNRDRPQNISDQIAKATKEAAKQNATIPEPEKAKKKTVRSER